MLSWVQRVLSWVQRVLSWAQRVLSWAQRSVSIIVYVPNVYQGTTPFLALCGSGVADCVQFLVQKGADTAISDRKGRGALQLARNCQGKNQKLASWLMNYVPCLPETSGPSRKAGVKHRGKFSYMFRKKTGCRIVKNKTL